MKTENKKISELLHKYALDKCTPEELEYISEYLKGQPKAIHMPEVDMLFDKLKKQGKVEDVDLEILFKDILTKSKSRERRQKNNSKRIYWNRITRYAAVLFGLLFSIGMGYLFLWDSNITSSDSLSKAVSLQLPDGTVKTLEDTSQQLIVDKKNRVVGKQEALAITYENIPESTELVYHTLFVPYGKKFELTLSDGTHIYLNSGTKLKYPVSFIKGKDREVFLSGEAFLEVARDTVRPFIVKTPEQLDVRVLGTKFNVSAYPEDTMFDVVLVEGAVKMQAEDKDYKIKEFLLKPGNKGSFNKGTLAIKNEKVITDIYTSWMDGELVFREMPFGNILKKLERYYDVKITIENDALSNEIFNASYKNITLENLLEDLKQTQNINYRIEGKEVSVF